MTVEQPRQKHAGSFFSGLMFLLLLSTALLAISCTRAEEPALQQQRFESPQQAVSALVAATKDNNEAGLLAILGPNSESLISSGDEVADDNGRARFVRAYEQRNNIDIETENRAILFVGEKDYPFPIPIVRQQDPWYFDTDAGREEILNRRIGRNELHTIEVMLAYTDAQREYACMVPNEGGQEFAQKFASSEGKRDGLYWETVEGEPESPFGPLIAEASSQGYEGRGLDREPPEPYHGYYFKILKGQGEHATGGAFDYVTNGKMVLGFALVAYPAKYGASGIMTFIINQEGVIYEKDLGKDTTAIASAMTIFDPDPSWHKYEEPAAQ